MGDRPVALGLDRSDNILRQRRGLAAMAAACLFSAIMGAAFFMAHVADPKFSSFTGSFIRVFANVLFISCIFRQGNESPFSFSPIRHKSLWFWGIFGALTVTTYFAAVNLVGSSTAAFLGASSGIFITALSPLVAGQKVTLKNWIGIGGSFTGMYLMCNTEMISQSSRGIFLAIASGFFGAMAYLMIARKRTEYSTSTIMSIWCLTSIAAHLLVFSLWHVEWPVRLNAWLLLLIAGFAASLAQHLTTYSYQRAPAGAAASLSYLAPVLSLLIDVVAFGAKPSLRVGFGAATILLFGALLPFIKSNSDKPLCTG